MTISRRRNWKYKHTKSRIYGNITRTDNGIYYNNNTSPTTEIDASTGEADRGQSPELRANDVLKS